jgi:hypothetical protein
MTWIVSLVSFLVGFIVGLVASASILVLTGGFDSLPLDGRSKGEQ